MRRDFINYIKFISQKFLTS